MEYTRKEGIRRARIEALKQDILARLSREKIDLKEFENLYCFRMGISKRTFKEYLDIALTLGGAKINKNSIELK